MPLADVHLTDGIESTKRMPPAVDILLAAGGALPLIFCALGSLSAQPSIKGVAITVAKAYGGCLLCFFGGVSRGLSFRQPRGPTVFQLAATVWLFAFGAITILLPWSVLSMLMLAIGLGSVMVIDTIAVRRREAPRYFLVLRSIQITVAFAAVVVLLVRSTVAL